MDPHTIPADTATSIARASYVDRFDSPSDAIEFENGALSIGREFLPASALAVLDEKQDSPAYYEWLISQIPEGDDACTSAKFERLPTHTVQLLRLTGYRAIEVAERWPGDFGLASWPTQNSEDEDDIAVERARELAAIDPEIIYATADLLFCQSELETWAVCGPLRALLATPSSRETDPPAVHPGEGIPPGCEAVAPAAVGVDLDALARRAADALAGRLAELLEEVGPHLRAPDGVDPEAVGDDLAELEAELARLAA